MPLYKTLTVDEHTRALFWKVTETESMLAQDITLTPHCQNRVNAMKSTMHRRAFLSVRHLMAQLGYQDKDLKYDPKGKPHLTDGTHVSISHSHEFTGIIVSSATEVGIDIEKQRDKILRIAHKFTPIEEYRTIANTSALIQKLTRVWCAKESLYKIFSTPGLSFLNHIDVEDFRLDDDHTLATINYHGEISTYRVTFDEFDEFSTAVALANL